MSRRHDAPLIAARKGEVVTRWRRTLISPSWAGSLAIAASLAVGPVSAQSLPTPPPLPPVPGEAPGAVPVDPDAPPPYELELDHLAERMGALAFLRGLCGDGDAGAFRDRMSALLDAEARSTPMRGRLAAAFNRGVDSYAVSYRTCTPSARLAIARSLAEASRLTADIQSRFGGS